MASLIEELGHIVDGQKLEQFTKELSKYFKQKFLKFPISLLRLRQIYKIYNKILDRYKLSHLTQYVGIFESL